MILVTNTLLAMIMIDKRIRMSNFQRWKLYHYYFPDWTLITSSTSWRRGWNAAKDWFACFVFDCFVDRNNLPTSNNWKLCLWVTCLENSAKCLVQRIWRGRIAKSFIQEYHTYRKTIILKFFSTNKRHKFHEIILWM